MRHVVNVRRLLLTALALVAGSGDVRLANAEDPTVEYVGPVHGDRKNDPRVDGDRALAAGRFEEARSLYEFAIERNPEDRHALREAGRAAHVLRQFEIAAGYLARASALGSRPDPELHYLLGEARWVLGQGALARQAYLRAQAELGKGPLVRIQKLWLARILGRLGDPAAANAMYEAMATEAPADAEIALAHAELHTTAADWPAAEQAVRRFLAHEPRHTRALEVLAWILEARGQGSNEMELRETLARDGERAESIRDYGRALERAGDWAGALVAYRRAARLPDGASDLELSRALARVDQRMSVELGAGVIARTDPSAAGLGAFTGMAVPFGRASHGALSVWHELVSSESRGLYAGGFRAAMSLRKREAIAIFGGTFGVLTAEADPSQMAPRRSMLAPGAFAAGNSGLLGGHVTLAFEAELGAMWRETPRAVFEGGRVDAATAHVYLTGLAHRLIIDTGVQGRRMRLTSDDSADPSASQLLAWGGADLVVWRDFTREATGQVLDDDMLRPTFAADAAVIGFRHYELFGASDAMFASRLQMADRASIDELSITARKVLAHGRVMIEARGGLGRDWARELNLARGALAMWLAPGARSRVSLSFELAKESVRAFEGERRTGWMTYHVDL